MISRLIAVNAAINAEYINCNTSNILYYTAILCHKLVLLVLVRLIAINNFNHTINRD